MVSRSARHLWWFLAIAAFLDALGKSVDADWLGALSRVCIAFATALIAATAGRSGELNGAPRVSAYVLIGVSIAITAGRLLGLLPHAPS